MAILSSVLSMLSALFSYFLNKNSNSALKIERLIIAVKYGLDNASNEESGNSNIMKKYEKKMKNNCCKRCVKI